MSIIHSEISGNDFNELCGDVKLFKFLNDELTHHDFTYKEGLNIDFVKFNPHNTCQRGGLYFCEEAKCHLFLRGFGTKLAYVRIPDDARVYIEKNKFKANKIIIDKILDFHDVDDKFWINIINKDSGVLEYIKKQTVDICIQAVKINGLNLRYVKGQTDEICMVAVKQNGMALQYVLKQTIDICILAVQQDGMALQYVKKPSGFISDCLSSVSSSLTPRLSSGMSSNMSSGLSLGFFTKEICTLAIQQNGYALQFVNDSSGLLTKKLCKLAVKQNGMALEYVKEKYQTEKICKLAIQQYSDAFIYVKNPTQTLIEERDKYHEKNGFVLNIENKQLDDLYASIIKENNNLLDTLSTTIL